MCMSIYVEMSIPSTHIIIFTMYCRKPLTCEVFVKIINWLRLLPITFDSSASYGLPQIHRDRYDSEQVKSP
jgi:hypothetical protein